MAISGELSQCRVSVFILASKFAIRAQVSEVKATRRVTSCLAWDLDVGDGDTSFRAFAPSSIFHSLPSSPTYRSVTRFLRRSSVSSSGERPLLSSILTRWHRARLLYRQRRQVPAAHLTQQICLNSGFLYFKRCELLPRHHTLTSRERGVREEQASVYFENGSGTASTKVRGVQTLTRVIFFVMWACLQSGILQNLKRKQTPFDLILPVLMSLSAGGY
ncbi:hypothetical protein EV421DRAFT_1906068 [Armillaria borealis]|uniref:Uncharacterized protein n=1 Tax=Armillaria borealis TaxID=47425 RepID=A0AA39MM58_9AGAR|nr:hypothetical protein EV421DRAFT_1906068 [Armillaria borealis]